MDVEWTAHAFLRVVGKCLLEKTVSVVAEFEWGFDKQYEECDGLKGEKWARKILIKELKEIDARLECQKLAVLRNEHKGWVFQEATDTS